MPSEVVDYTTLLLNHVSLLRVMHRDLKPDDIGFDIQGNLRLLLSLVVECRCIMHSPNFVVNILLLHTHMQVT